MAHKTLSFTPVHKLLFSVDLPKRFAHTVMFLCICRYVRARGSVSEGDACSGSCAREVGGSQGGGSRARSGGDGGAPTLRGEGATSMLETGKDAPVGEKCLEGVVNNFCVGVGPTLSRIESGCPNRSLFQGPT